MYKKNRDEYKKSQAKTKLINACISKVKTTMIGAISDIEKNLGNFINTDKGYELFNVIRSSILDRGNDQIRSLEQELQAYDISYNSYLLKPIFKKD